MTKEELKILENEIERLKAIIKPLYEMPKTKHYAIGLSYTNKYLHELLIKAVLEKDEYNIYIHQDDYEETRQRAIAEGWATYYSKRKR